MVHVATVHIQNRVPNLSFGAQTAPSSFGDIKSCAIHQSCQCIKPRIYKQFGSMSVEGVNSSI